MQSPAAILLAFANDWVDDQRHLRSLLEESKAIDKALAPLVETGALTLPSPIHNATVDEVIGAFREHRYRDRIRIFHFGGHASGSMLLFEDKAGRPSGAHAEGLAGYLGRQPGLVLVFLNGCCTEPQVRQLRAAGIRAVVATTSVIQDGVAAEFAAAFYAELATRSLREAYETAVQAVRLRSGDDPRSVTRDVSGVAREDDTESPQWPWIFDCAPDHEGWTLAAELTRQSRRARRRRMLLAAAALPLLWIMALVLSADARRTTCRVRGLRSLCAAAGIGLTPAEEALWDAARSQRSGDGLRAYLSSYPAGAYADEARSRLAGCRSEHVETPGPTDDRRYPGWRVSPSPAHSFPTEQGARADALKRGSDDASITCAFFGLKDSLLSASIEPHADAWHCPEYEHTFTCGFEGDLICRVQRRILSVEERCNDQPE